MYDAVHLFAKALQQVPQYVSTTSLSCDRGDVWNFGTSIMNYIRLVLKSLLKSINTYCM